MNAGDFAADYQPAPALATGPSLWLRQLLAILRIEFAKALFSRRAISSYGLAAIPVLVLAVAAWESIDQGDPVFESIESARQNFGIVFSSLIMGSVIYLGSALIFTTLFRGEILDRSVHYYLLSPVRREVLAVGKFLAGLSSAFLLFGGSAMLCFLLLYVPFGMTQFVTDLGNGIALSQIGMYLGVTFLACLGYGSVFMATGLLFRNPLIPVAVIAGWELIHFILPPALKVFSVIYYLKGLMPIPLTEGPLAVLVAPPPVWVSIFGMLLLSIAMLAIAAQLLRRMEVKYTDE